MKIFSLISTVVIIVSITTNLCIAQYDVLPTDGRNELFHNYLLEEFDRLTDLRNTAVEDAVESEVNIIARQQKLRYDYYSLLGRFPEKTLLNAEVVKTINTTDGYYIENIHYQSVPNHHVTANFYIPDTDNAPFPTVIFLCGHYPVAKSYTDYQKLAILFAKNGIAALVVDPICQGERYQITNELGNPAFVGQSGTSAHSQLDVGSVLNGTSVVAYELWDNHRGVDYLYSRTDVVDTESIGCFGHSGGGAQATYLLAYDTRLKVGAVANFITNEPSMFKVSGPQTASQNLSYEGENGIDQPDYVELFAPKPYLIIGTTNDNIFKIDATRETYNEVLEFYTTFGESDKISLFETSDAHDLTKIKREKTVYWFKKWFYNNVDMVVESDQTVLPQSELTVTSLGQVLLSFDDEVNITDLNLEKADSLENERAEYWNEHEKYECVYKIGALIKYEQLNGTIQYETTENIARDNYTIEKGKISYENHVPVTTLTFVPNENTAKLPAILYVDGRGKAEDAGDFGLIEQVYTDSGYIVMSIDVRGFGETTDSSSKNESKHKNKEHRNAVISLYIGKTLVGQRVEDIEKAMHILCQRSDVDTSNVTIVGIDRASVAVLHAAALDTRFENVVIRQANDSTWIDAIADPTIKDQMTHEVPAAMRFYDICDLIDRAIAPRQVIFAPEPVLQEPSGLNLPYIKNNSYQNYPNPFSTTSEINLQLDRNCDVTINIFSLDGKKVKTMQQAAQAGSSYIELKARNYLPGIYLYNVLVNNKNIATHKMVVSEQN